MMLNILVRELYKFKQLLASLLSTSMLSASSTNTYARDEQNHIVYVLRHIVCWT